MRVLVTGASGFTGRYLLPVLEAHGHEPVAMDADITDAEAVKDEVARIRPDATVHLAAKAFVHSADFASFHTVNQIGSFNLLDALASSVPGAPILLASSAQVYGPQASGLIDEDATPTPANHYALSKAAMELGSALWGDRLRIIRVRPFNYTGIGQDPVYLIPKIVDHYRRRAPVIELGRIDVERDFGDVRSVAKAYCGLIENKETVGVFNVATGRLWTIRAILDLLTELTGHSPEIRVNQTFVRPNEVASLGGDRTRLSLTLPDWRAIPLEDTLGWMMSA